MEHRLENRCRKIIRARMERNDRKRLAKAAGHEKNDGSWVSNWLKGTQKHASIDEIANMAAELGLVFATMVSNARLDEDLLTQLSDREKAEQVRPFLALGEEGRRLVVQMSPLVRSQLDTGPSTESMPEQAATADTTSERARRPRAQGKRGRG